MIFAIKPFEIHDGDGIRTTVFFKGCPLRCKWCHNPESLQPLRQMLYESALCAHCLQCTALCEANRVENGRHVFYREACDLCGKCLQRCPNTAFEISGEERSAEEIAREVLKDAIFLKGSGGGVTFSGGEPLLQVDLCIELAKILKAHGLNIAIDTCGYVKREAIQRILPYVDTFLFDIKAIDGDVHRACTGVSNELILENIKYVDSLGVPMEIRYPYVPTLTDGQALKIAEFVKGLKNVKAMRVLAYHNYAERKYGLLGMEYPLPEVPLPTREELTAVREQIRACGVECIAFE